MMSWQKEREREKEKKSETARVLLWGARRADDCDKTFYLRYNVSILHMVLMTWKVFRKLESGTRIGTVFTAATERRHWRYTASWSFAVLVVNARRDDTMVRLVDVDDVYRMC